MTIKDSSNADVTNNYNVAYVDNTTSTINKADLTVTALAVTKGYDGTTSATGTGAVGALAGAGAGESVNNAGIQTFTDKNAGTGKTVKASGVTIKDSSGADVTSNYTVAYADNTASTIVKKSITLDGITAANKTYDGNTSATVSVANATFNNKVAGDDLSVSSTGTFSDKNAATGKTVSLTNSLGGADLANYNVTTQATTTADISKKSITLDGITAANKTYDGTTAATVSTTGAVFKDQISGDVLTVSSTGIGLDESSARARISRYELGVHEAAVPTAKKIASTLKVPLAYLYCEDDSTAKLLVELHKLNVKERSNRVQKFLDELEIT